MRHVNIPVFIPHLGCPNACVFCNQHTITGHGSFSLMAVQAEIERVLATLGAEDEVEIAFFGGSFTGIGEEKMRALLSIAEQYCRQGSVSSIRLSTRPDYINNKILSILSEYSVRHIELGIQSFSDVVLTACRRGHSAATALAACRAVRRAGFSLVGQMMVGLPSSAYADEEETARILIAEKVDAVRIYPTVVFHETELCRMTEQGHYHPLTREEAVTRTAGLLDLFDRASVPVIRVGLCAAEGLTAPDGIAAGDYHPAFGELAASALYLRRAREALDALPPTWRAGDLLTLYCRSGGSSALIGQHRHNLEILCREYEINRIKVIEKSDILGYNIKVYG